MKISNLKNGFTLIELLLVVSLIGVLSSVGIASFVSYSRSQSVSTTAQDVVSILGVAKSRALSQVKQCSTSSETMQGYKVLFCTSAATCLRSGDDYELVAQCSSGDNLIQGKKLGSNITFAQSTPTSVFFPIFTGSATLSNGASNIITVTGYGTSKSITISPQDGRIILN